MSGNTSLCNVKINNENQNHDQNQNQNQINCYNSIINNK